MFNVNDTVVYSPCGVCRIDDISERDFSGEKVLYYVLKPVKDNKNTFYVPVHNENITAQMKNILTREEIEELIHSMPDEELIWIEDEYQRKEVYKEILKKGDRHDLVKLIKTLYIHKKSQQERRKKLHSADEHFLKDAENVLYDEFSYVLDIPRDKVVSYIKSNL